MRDAHPRSPNRAQAAVWTGAHHGFRWLCRRRVVLQVEGLEHVPRRGPVLIAARHYHHFWDGAALVGTLNRPVHVVVGLDWIRQPLLRRAMETLCGFAQWPVILRTDGLRPSTPAKHAAARRYLRSAIAATVGLLRGGGLVVVFPEGYPDVDPNPNPKAANGSLPFRPGFAQIAQLAQSDGTTRVPIVPAGLFYERASGRGKAWRIVLRFGRPLHVERNADRATVVAAVEERVRALSGRPA